MHKKIILLFSFLFIVQSKAMEESRLKSTLEVVPLDIQYAIIASVLEEMRIENIKEQCGDDSFFSGELDSKKVTKSLSGGVFVANVGEGRSFAVQPSKEKGDFSWIRGSCSSRKNKDKSIQVRLVLTYEDERWENDDSKKLSIEDKEVTLPSTCLLPENKMPHIRVGLYEDKLCLLYCINTLNEPSVTYKVNIQDCATVSAFNVFKNLLEKKPLNVREYIFLLTLARHKAPLYLNVSTKELLKKYSAVTKPLYVVQSNSEKNDIYRLLLKKREKLAPRQGEASP